MMAIKGRLMQAFKDKQFDLVLAEYEAMSGVSFAKKAVAGRAERGGLRKDEFYDRFADLEAMLAARDAA